jgi:hypothetical protein
MNPVFQRRQIDPHGVARVAARAMTLLAAADSPARSAGTVRGHLAFVSEMNERDARKSWNSRSHSDRNREPTLGENGVRPDFERQAVQKGIRSLFAKCWLKSARKGKRTTWSNAFVIVWARFERRRQRLEGKTQFLFSVS